MCLLQQGEEGLRVWETAGLERSLWRGAKGQSVCTSGEGLVVWGIPECREDRGQQGRERLQVAARGFHWWRGQGPLCFNYVSREWLKQDDTGTASAQPWNCTL